MSRRHLATVLLAVACLLAWAAACSRGADTAPTPTVCVEADSGAPVDPKLLAFLSKARSAHHGADVHEESQNLAGAVSTLEQVVDEPAPGGAQPPIEAREVLADTYARLADLRSRQGQFEAAARDIQEGLSNAKETTYFRGHLFEVKGLVAERRAKKLADDGDEEGAKAAKAAALDAFEQSMKIQSEVIEKTLPGGPKP